MYMLFWSVRVCSVPCRYEPESGHGHTSAPPAERVAGGRRPWVYCFVQVVLFSTGLFCSMLVRAGVLARTYLGTSSGEGGLRETATGREKSGKNQERINMGWHWPCRASKTRWSKSIVLPADRRCADWKWAQQYHVWGCCRVWRGLLPSHPVLQHLPLAASSDTSLRAKGGFPPGLLLRFGGLLRTCPDS